MTKPSGILVLGAASDMARACIQALAQEYKGRTFYLAGRDLSAMEQQVADLSLRTGCAMSAHHFDALDPSNHAALWENLKDKVDLVLCCVGLLGDQMAARHDVALAERIVRTNFTGLIPMLTLVADTFEERKAGTLIVVSSVAGDRGRASNYVYGSAKAGLSAFLSGLRQRLHNHGVKVITVMPGFVKTRMVEGMELPEALTATPEQVAADVIAAVRKDKGVVYTRFFWRFIMFIVKSIPEGIFRKMERF
ncbi:MAG TPA: SDR family oxidoreductase [Candidatus Anaerobiospirillum stercoravium]|nr:SDR family oxidoreductase [Candidatus Anaerobiospirillum stercoravium]